MIPSIAFVGAGPTTIYTLNALLNCAKRSFALTIFEEQAIPGRGTPYRPGWNDPAMLSNIASIEIPPLVETLVEWLERQPAPRLARLGIKPTEIDDHAFYPRLELGEFFKDQFQLLIERAKSRDIQVEVQTRCRVLDAVARPEGVFLSIKPYGSDKREQRFDHLVLATGHQWPEHPEVRPGYFLSPWPASALKIIPACKIGIRGASLTAIDAAVALAVTHGEFSEDGRGELSYKLRPKTTGFHMTMMSRKGLLPEADFYHPVPYEPLQFCTKEAMEELIGCGEPQLLDKAYLLFRRELASLDPQYAADLNLMDLALEEFCDRYFAERMSVDPFTWAEQNLKQAEQNYRDKFTVPWRYAILRMHESIALLAPHLGEEEFERFSRYFKPVFVDDYATVPHESIKRLLALHRLGRLDVIALGDDYKIDGHRPDSGAMLCIGDQRLHFPVFIDATGQRPLGSKDFPFASLRQQGIVRDELIGKDTGASRGIVVDDQFHLISEAIPANQLFCLSLAFILGRHPFIQGITSSQEMGEVVGQALASAIGQDQNTSAHFEKSLAKAAQ